MALVSRAFNGRTFFHDIRTDMDRNRGMFAGADGAFRYVCVDASFYRLGLVLRPAASTFTDAAVALPQYVRAVANGSMWLTPYCYVGPCPVVWEGTIVDNRLPRAGNPKRRPTFRYFGQWEGCGEGSFGAGTGDPDQATPLFRDALGRLLPLVEKGIGGAQKPLGSYLSEPNTTGKSVYGLCRAAQVAFFLVQEHLSAGLMVQDLIKRLIGMGVDDALLGDGSTSAALIVDGSIEIAPTLDPRKNWSIPLGVTLAQFALGLTGSRTLANTQRTTDPEFQLLTSVVDTEGAFALTDSGVELRVTNIGTPVGMTNSSFDAALGATVPLQLNATGTVLTRPALFTGSQAGAILQLFPQKDAPSYIKGSLTFTTRRGVLDLDVNWLVEHSR